MKFIPVQKGIPDRIVILPQGRVRFVELKTHRGRTSALQEHWHGQARGLGARVDVVVGKDGVDLWIRQVAPETAPRPRRRRRTKAEIARDKAQDRIDKEIAEARARIAAEAAAEDMLEQVS